jgi:hypothetical protein
LGGRPMRPEITLRDQAFLNVPPVALHTHPVMSRIRCLNRSSCFGAIVRLMSERRAPGGKLGASQNEKFPSFATCRRG